MYTYRASNVYVKNILVRHWANELPINRRQLPINQRPSHIKYIKNNILSLFFFFEKVTASFVAKATHKGKKKQGLVACAVIGKKSYILPFLLI